MTGRDTRILISGGGIAGAALAYWLRRHGFRPTVVERAPAVRTGGYRIQVEGSGLRALDHMGVLPELRRRGGRAPAALRLAVRPGGRPITLPGGGAVSDEPGLVVRRGTAAEVIYRRTSEEVEYRFDDSIASLKEHADGITVAFENRPSEDYDLVIGADGIGSRARRLAFGAADPIRYLGTNLALFTLDNELGLRDEVIGHCWPRRGCLVSTFPGNGELEGLFLFRSADPVDDVEEHKHLVRTVFAEDGWHVPRLLRAMDEAPFVHFAPTAQVRMDSWTTGRVALVGDAGYCPDPMTGQGTSLALIGAAVLAAALAAADGDHRAAYPAYESAIRDFVGANHAMVGGITDLVVPAASPAGLRMREPLLRALFRLVALAGVPSRVRGAYTFPLEDHVPPR